MARKQNKLQGQSQSVLPNLKNYEHKNNLSTQAVTNANTDLWHARMDEKGLRLSGSTESIQCSLDNHLSLEFPSIHHHSEETFLLYAVLQRFFYPLSCDEPRSSVAGKVDDCGVN
ncbi:hypothetical protein CEXT_431831 [Caerostris extrusa]|uniref:Uncharacterized protein n=1 Tax=Caerostris extrusa TaxID=172846 RepID=A0AAV4TCC5_CAEEX|nr:hypothetical protein CEXT_431831 [Caerostris extrusa]